MPAKPTQPVKPVRHPILLQIFGGSVIVFPIYTTVAGLIAGDYVFAFFCFILFVFFTFCISELIGYSLILKDNVLHHRPGFLVNFFGGVRQIPLEEIDSIFIESRGRINLILKDEREIYVPGYSRGKLLVEYLRKQGFKVERE